MFNRSGPSQSQVNWMKRKREGKREREREREREKERERERKRESSVSRLIKVSKRAVYLRLKPVNKELALKKSIMRMASAKIHNKKEHNCLTYMCDSIYSVA